MVPLCCGSLRAKGPRLQSLLSSDSSFCNAQYFLPLEREVGDYVFRGQEPLSRPFLLLGLPSIYFQGYIAAPFPPSHCRYRGADVREILKIGLKTVARATPKCGVVASKQGRRRTVSIKTSALAHVPWHC